MKISSSAVPVYTIAGSEARPLPDWLQRRRKRSLKQDPEYASRVELLQDFEFDEASQCVRVSEDGDWVMSTGTYKPQIHVHYLPQLSLSFARHTDTLNQTFRLLSTDYSKSVHLDTNRSLSLHTPGGCHYTCRIPRYGRDLLLDRHAAECLIPSVGVNQEGAGECYRLNLEVGRFMKSYEVRVGHDNTTSLQGGVNAGAINTGAIAEETHNLLALGTSIGTIEFFDSRSRTRVGLLSAPQDSFEGSSEVTALSFHRSGLELASGDSNGIVRLWDLRHPTPILRKDHGYSYPIKNIVYLDSNTQTRNQTTEPKVMVADQRIIKIWDRRDGKPWTSVEPTVDLNHVEWCRDSGLILTANEGKQQHAFFIPQLGPAPRWCTFLDNIVEEMAEDPNDPNAFGKNSTGEVYDNFKFLTHQQLRQLHLDHLIGQTSLLRPYMHGFFVAQKLYEEARLIANPDIWQEQRAKSIQEKINKERESRIRGNKKANVKVNRKLAERMLERQEKEERRRARRVLEKGGDEEMVDIDNDKPVGGAGADDQEEGPKSSGGVLNDPRFARLFEDEDFEIDERSREFQALNPSTKTRLPKGLTTVEQEALDERRGSEDSSSSEEDDDDDEDEAPVVRKPKNNDHGRISSSSYKKSGHKPQQQQQRGPQMQVSSSHSNPKKPDRSRDKSFGSRVSKLDKDGSSSSKTAGGRAGGPASSTVVGEREITFAPEKKKPKQKRGRHGEDEAGEEGSSAQKQHDGKKDRRSASGNVFRSM